jgi:hypothetical protein
MSEYRQNHGRSHGVATAALFATFLLVATVASAGSDTTKPYNSTTTNPCPPTDSVTFQGQQHTVNNSNIANGRTHVNITDQILGSGVGSPSQLQYRVGLTTSVNGWFPPGPLVFRTRSKVVSNGPADNFFQTSIMRFNQDGTPGTSNLESDCRG